MMIPQPSALPPEVLEPSTGRWGRGGEGANGLVDCRRGMGRFRYDPPSMWHQQSQVGRAKPCWSFAKVGEKERQENMGTMLCPAAWKGTRDITNNVYHYTGPEKPWLAHFTWFDCFRVQGRSRNHSPTFLKYSSPMSKLSAKVANIPQLWGADLHRRSHNSGLNAFFFHLLQVLEGKTYRMVTDRPGNLVSHL